MLLSKLHLNNQHIGIVRIFLHCKFLITELQVLVYFAHVVTLFFYFVEVTSKNRLLKMLPGIFNDLERGTIDTLKKHRVELPNQQ